ncbi:Lysine-specific demethylase 5C [Hondaea fermentalgiana]|uniref:Lysine-specific demethylase 5C n=1 Tax=Hondaea fermentalgiana TaxID=2315210 RepID=A0A2R5GWL8_9STRA|nr:Lysine-specific demethylase 5C [Hondaea fermentalgiana]|eukprot:GBG32334.1 Lysine-specific demethylase 5C [Hondaea fermentalgiana]
MSAPQAPKGNGSAHKPGPAGDINVNTATPKNTTSLVPEGKSNARKEAQTQAKTSKPSKPKATVAPTKIIPVTKGVGEKTSRAAANPVAPQGGNVPLAAGGSSFVKPEAPIPLQAPKEEVLAPPPWRDGGARADVISPLPMNRVERFVERHRRWKNRYCWPDEEASEVLSYRDVHLNVDAVTTKQLCVCQLCKCKVGVTRFANHLETCSRRAARKRGRTSAAQGSVASVGSTSVLAQASQGDLSRGSANKKARAGTSASLGAAARAHASLAEANIKKKSLSLAREASKKLPAPVFLDESFRCRACNLRGNVDDSTILCDGCDRGYHIRCIHRLGLNVDKLARDDGKETVDELRDRLTSIAEPYFCVECLPKLGEEHRGTVNSPTLGMSTSEKVKHGRIYAETGPIEFICDSCQKQISKSRWRCLVCNNFDACNDCHQNFVRHANNPKASFEASMSSSLNSESPSGTKPCVHHGTHRAQRIAL